MPAKYNANMSCALDRYCVQHRTQRTNTKNQSATRLVLFLFLLYFFSTLISIFSNFLVNGQIKTNKDVQRRRILQHRPKSNNSNAGADSQSVHRKRQDIDESNFEPNYDAHDESMTATTTTMTTTISSTTTTTATPTVHKSKSKFGDQVAQSKSKTKSESRKRSRSYSSSSSSSDSD